MQEVDLLVSLSISNISLVDLDLPIPFHRAFRRARSTSAQAQEKLSSKNNANSIDRLQNFLVSISRHSLHQIDIQHTKLNYELNNCSSQVDFLAAVPSIYDCMISRSR